MNCLINDLLESVDMRAEELFVRFQEERSDEMKTLENKLKCCYHCKHTPKHRFDIMGVLDECEEAFENRLLIHKKMNLN